VGDRVLVGAGFIFNEGKITSLTCKGGNVAKGVPCVIVKEIGLPESQDIPLGLVHPIDGHVVTAPPAGEHLVCGRSEPAPNTQAWVPCRTVASAGGVNCELSEPLGPPIPCAGMTLVEVGPETAKGIAEALSEAKPAP
jgi:hypothetical protein